MSSQNNSFWQQKPVVVIGAGCAGLTAAYELCKAGTESIVLEKDSTVGGLARTIDYNGYHFDIGGHRFFTKVKVVEDMWEEVLGDDFLTCSRLSRIYYNNRFFFYPFRAFDAITGLGHWTSLMIFLSCVKSQIFPQRPEVTFEQWISNRFGKRLYHTFFKTYTEKVWGIPCNQISAEWAAQRIKGLSLLAALKSVVLKTPKDGNVIKTLIDSFKYPKLGPGMMWETVADIVKKKGAAVCLESNIEKIICKDSKVDWMEVSVNGKIELVKGDHYICSMPIQEVIWKIEPAPPKEVLDAASQLNYRDFLTVALIVNQKDIFDDNWIYVHDPDVKVGRIQNFKNWSPYMVKDQNKTCLGLEYFCFEGDGLWSMSDEDLIRFGKKEIEALGLIKGAEIDDGAVVRAPKAYPVYDATYRDSLQIIRAYLDKISNLHQVGRNGMHKYNNQDHSMLTAMYAVKNVLGANYNLWAINADQEYHEHIADADQSKEISRLELTQPLVPKRTAVDEALMHLFAKMDKFAFATSVGLVSGFIGFCLTIWLLIGPNSDVVNTVLLSQYFSGYTISLNGAFMSMGYGLLLGFMWGWLFAYLRNLFLGFYIYKVKTSKQLVSFNDFIDHL